VRVLAHPAEFLTGPDEGTWCFFVKITNLRRHPIEVSHVWFEHPDGGRHINVLDGVPHLIPSWTTYEVWLPLIRIGLLTADLSVVMETSYETCMRVKLGHGPVIAARSNTTVPSIGRVAR
jgi:hypothetical protein